MGEVAVPRPDWMNGDGYLPRRCTNCNRVGWYKRDLTGGICGYCVCDGCGRDDLTELAEEEAYRCGSCGAKAQIADCPNCEESQLIELRKRLVPGDAS